MLATILHCDFCKQPIPGDELNDAVVIMINGYKAGLALRSPDQATANDVAICINCAPEVFCYLHNRNDYNFDELKEKMAKQNGEEMYKGESRVILDRSSEEGDR